MSEPEIAPEIARRCSACGVSVRERAMFCPLCGNPITQPEATTNAPVSETIAEPAPASAPKVYDDGKLGRVEKLRRVSSVVIDQAAYDPSLRFLLVAAVMFLFFLVLLILSKVLG